MLLGAQKNDPEAGTYHLHWKQPLVGQLPGGIDAKVQKGAQCSAEWYHQGTA